MPTFRWCVVIRDGARTCDSATKHGAAGSDGFPMPFERSLALRSSPLPRRDGASRCGHDEPTKSSRGDAPDAKDAMTMSGTDRKPRLAHPIGEKPRVRRPSSCCGLSPARNIR
jgi:hypothetical protein